MGVGALDEPSLRPGGEVLPDRAAGAEALTDRAAGDVLFMTEAGPIGRAAFLADVRRVAASLPPGRHLVNLCEGRYAFAVAFAAGLVAGRVALLNVDPTRLEALAAAYESCTVAVDQPVVCGLPTTMVRHETGQRGAGRVPRVRRDRVAAIVFTSGSTGSPVPHPKRWGALVDRSRAAVGPLGLADVGGGAGSVVGMVPPQHMYGFELTVLLPLHAPVCSWCGPAFFNGDVAAAIASCPAPRSLVSTPLQLRALLDGGMALPLARAISATAPLEPALAARAEAAWGAPVLEVFGATEVGSIASRRTTDGPEWRLYEGVTLGPGPVVMAADAPDVLLADVVEPVPGGFRLVGRRTDLVKMGGRRASLSGLNEVLVGLPGVDDGAFVLPDAADGARERLVAVVVAPGRTALAILAELRGLIDPVFLPRRIVQVDRLPRNALGKLPRQALLQLVGTP